MSAPFATEVKPLQVPSGTAVLPVRTLSATAVPVGVVAIQLSAPQSEPWPASKTRESKVPGVV